ncbi:hypothetical protein IT411_00970 [Candidatus Peregrinibacteria bacterium]|nr:hypothetical protein [Candidatus Peregrinibacteria bacterium]
MAKPQIKKPQLENLPLQDKQTLENLITKAIYNSKKKILTQKPKKI